MKVEGKARPVRLRAALRRHGLVRRPHALQQFLRVQGVRLTEGNRVRFFDDGAAALAAMLAAIRGARQRVHLETYILRGDDTGRAFLEAMEAKAREGVAVRLLYDAFGSRALDSALLTGLRAARGDIVVFNPLRRFYPHWLPRRRDHRKILVVDGRVAFTGGLNIGDEYNASPQSVRGWRDTHVQVEGPVVRDLEALFLESWFRADGPDLPWDQFLGPAPPPCGSERCAVVPDGPSYHRRVVRDLLLVGLRTAQREAKLTSPYFAPDRKVLGALAETASRGIAVRLLLAGRSDHPILRRAARALLPRLLAAGVEIYEYRQSILHAKTMVFDQQWGVIGTSNLDRQSFEHSYEVNLLVEAGTAARELAAMFDRDLAGSSRIDLASLAKRSRFERFVDWLASLALLVI